MVGWTSRNFKETKKEESNIYQLFEVEAEVEADIKEVEATTFNLDDFIDKATDDEINQYLENSSPERQELIANKLSKIGRNNKLLNNYNRYKKVWAILNPIKEFDINIGKYQSKIWGSLATKMENELKNPKEV